MHQHEFDFLWYELFRYISVRIMLIFPKNHLPYMQLQKSKDNLKIPIIECNVEPCTTPSRSSFISLYSLLPCGPFWKENRPLHHSNCLHLWPVNLQIRKRRRCDCEEIIYRPDLGRLARRRVKLISNLGSHIFFWGIERRRKMHDVRFETLIWIQLGHGSVINLAALNLR